METEMDNFDSPGGSDMRHQNLDLEEADRYFSEIEAVVVASVVLGLAFLILS